MDWDGFLEDNQGIRQRYQDPRLWPFLEKKRRRGKEHASHGKPPILESEPDPTWLITRSLD